MEGPKPGKCGSPAWWRAQNLALFFTLPLPLSFFFSLWESSRGILVFEAPGPSNVTKRAHLMVPAFKNTQIQREDPKREREKERNGGGRRNKKSEILGSPAQGGPVEGGPADRVRGGRDGGRKVERAQKS